MFAVVTLRKRVVMQASASVLKKVGESPWTALFRDLPREHGFEPLTVEGVIPRELSGVLYRNGPGKFGSHGAGYGHLFDGDGAITGIQISGGQAAASCRLIKSEAVIEEARREKMQYGGFGTRLPGYLWQMLTGQIRNPANTNVIVWNEQVLALFEASLPTRLSFDLETLGVTDLAGVIPEAFSAHPHFVPGRNTLYNFGLRAGLRSQLDLFAWPANKALKRLTTVSLSGRIWLHDFAVTENYAVFFVAPIKVKLASLLFASQPLSKCLKWNPQDGTEVIIIALDSPHDVQRFKVDAFYQWHFANAFEQESGAIIVDLLRYDDFKTYHWLDAITHGPTDFEAPGTFFRASIQPKAKTLHWTQISKLPAEFPRIAPCYQGRAYQYVYFAAHKDATSTRAGLQDRIVKLDVHSGQERLYVCKPGQYIGEPVVVSRSAKEDEAWLLAMVYDSAIDSSQLVILDAQDIEQGPIARAHFDHRIPMSFHGSWHER
jgi:all-trans-8'-apo-beta-carotenal 15,15'-oxygenase